MKAYFMTSNGDKYFPRLDDALRLCCEGRSDGSVLIGGLWLTLTKDIPNIQYRNTIKTIASTLVCDQEAYDLIHPLANGKFQDVPVVLVNE